VKEFTASDDEIYLINSIGMCLAIGGWRPEREVMVCASRSLLHRRAGLCTVQDYVYSFIRVTGYGLRMFGTKVVAVSVVWMASALEALSEGRRMSREHKLQP
jgi:hypothetical protein